jgi:AdoMet-dependent heme synthase
LLPYFHTLYLETTRSCNFGCANCSSGSHLKNVIWGEELSTDQIINRVLKPAYELGTRNIAFSGGEFLLRKDAFELLEEADKTGFRLSVVSNGSTLNDKTISKLKELLANNLMISLGINSFDNDENSSTRCVTGDSLLDLIKKLEHEYINMNICVTVGMQTADSLHLTLDKIRELKLPHNRIPYAPRHTNEKHLMFDKETLKNKIHPALRKYFQGYVSFIPYFIPPEIHKKYSGQSENEWNVPTNPSGGCWCGSFYSINPEGEVSPCPLLGDHFTGGNVLNQDLKNILFKSELFQKIVSRKDFGGRCGKCRYRFTCGGCRTMAYYQTGDVFAEDPTCFIDELSENELKEIEKEMVKKFINCVRLSGIGGLYISEENH